MDKATKGQLKELRELLQDKKKRNETGTFVLEGLKIVHDMIEKDIKLKSVFISSDFKQEDIIKTSQEKDIPVFTIKAKDFDRVSNLQNSQGVLAVAEKPMYSKDMFLNREGSFLVLCDGIQDPGNLGNIIRTAVAFNFSAILFTGEAVDIFNPKVVRSSSGMITDIPAIYVSPEEIKELKKKNFSMFTGQLDKEKAKKLEEIQDLPSKAIITFGSEGRGVSKEVLELSDEFFYIPISEKVESLNVSSAAAIVLHYFAGGVL